LKTNNPHVDTIIEYEKKEEILESITELTNREREEELTHYPYSLTGKVDEIHSRASATVTFTIEDKRYSYMAKSTEILHERDKTKEVLLTFNEGKIEQPIITGIIQTNKNEPLIFSSKEGILLECGETRIELSHEGTLDLNALHINSQAYGPYRIKGASVKIN